MNTRKRLGERNLEKYSIVWYHLKCLILHKFIMTQRIEYIENVCVYISELSPIVISVAVRHRNYSDRRNSVPFKRLLQEWMEAVCTTTFNFR